MAGSPKDERRNGFCGYLAESVAGEEIHRGLVGTALQRVRDGLAMRVNPVGGLVVLRVDVRLEVVAPQRPPHPGR